MHTETDPKTKRRNAIIKNNKLTVSHIWKRFLFADDKPESSPCHHLLLTFFSHTHPRSERTKNVAFLSRARYAGGLGGWMNGRHLLRGNHRQTLGERRRIACHLKPHASKDDTTNNNNCDERETNMNMNIRTTPGTCSNHKIPNRAKRKKKKNYNRKWKTNTSNGVENAHWCYHRREKQKHFNPTKRNQEVNNGFLLNFIIKQFGKYQN